MSRENWLKLKRNGVEHSEELTEEQRQKILDISSDFYRYSDNNLYIKDKDAQIIPFVPNRAQRILIDYVLRCLADGIPVRVIILKARQMGLSTAVEALIYWWTATHKNITSMIVGHEDSSSKNLYNMFKRYYANSNLLFKPSVRYDTKSDLTFSRLNHEGREMGLGSVIKTATAKNVSAGRSDTIQLLHASEVGEWEHGEELVAALLQTVPVRPNTMVFLESTAKGMGNYFHKEWENAMKGDSIFKPFFLPWWIHDEYEMEGQIDQYTDEEEEIVKLMRENEFGETYTEEQIERKILFRRYKEKEFKTDKMLLYQEYPSTDYEAFLASGRPRFDIPSLVEMKKRTFDPIGEFELKLLPDRTISANAVTGAALKIWKHPERGKEYVIGADVAEGLEHGDFSVADVIDKDTLETVARYRGHPDPDVFGNVLNELGIYYNYALIGCEINNHGLTTVQRLRDLFYTNLYRRERGVDERFEESTEKLGWKTDARTKPLMIDGLAEAIREGSIIEPDEVFVREAMTYVVDDNGRTNAEDGCFDDCVVAKAIGLQMFEWSYGNKSSLQVTAPSKMVSRKRANKVIG